MPHATSHVLHPDRSQLEGFLLGKLDRAKRMAVLAHLIHGCAACQATLAPLANVMFRPERSQLQGRNHAADYDAAIDRAFGALDPLAKRRLTARAAFVRASGRGEIEWAVCEALLDASWEQRHDDAEAMVLLASVAATVAESIDPVTRGSAALADLQARALADLGNARRVANDLAAAQADLLRARRRAEQGTGDTLLLGRLLELTAALRIDQRRFDEAETLLEWGLQVYESVDASHLAGKVLTQKAHLSLVDGRPEQAAGMLARALTLLDPVLEPTVLLAAIHNLLDCCVHCGRFREAWQLLWRARKLYAAHGGRFHHLRLLWIEGRVDAGLGYHGRAERCFGKARAGFLDAKLPYFAALVAMDLGVLLLEKGRVAEARKLAEDTLETFNLLHIGREAMGAYILLTDAVHQEQLTIAALREIAAELRKAER